MLVATVGIGSNSLRMLIAEIKGAQLRRVFRDRSGLRVFAALDEYGNISAEMMERAAQSVLAFVDKAKAFQAEKIHIFATSAVRDAKNQQAFCERIFEATGIALEVCSGEKEAMLSFLGAVESERSGIIDIGGGSTEIVVGHGTEILCSKSLQMGAVRLFKQMPAGTAGEAYAVADHARAILTPEIAAIQARGDVHWVGVGGTFTTMAALLQGIPWTQKELIHGYRISRDAVAQSIEWLAPLGIEERMLLKGLQPQRADIVVHGLAILLGCMQGLEIPEIMVSEYGNLEGYLKYRYEIQ